MKEKDWRWAKRNDWEALIKSITLQMVTSLHAAPGRGAVKADSYLVTTVLLLSPCCLAGSVRDCTSCPH